jgi:formylglycine-generating enzyme required for sulfatase activity
MQQFGSHLSAPSYCLLYRPAGRQSEVIDTATCHLRFRCVVHRGSYGETTRVREPARAY